MTTSRTGTTRYLRERRATIARDRAAGVTHCPLCMVELDYDTPRLPHSAETDHVLQYNRGGDDDRDNMRVICRLCNQKRNAHTPRIGADDGADPFPVSLRW